MELKLIPAGTFLMGSPESEKDRQKDETQHEVTISKPFYMGVTPVTQAQYQAVMGNNPSGFKGDTLPVEQVSWDNAVAFCQRLGAKDGKHYRLPSEAQWEYACRAGTTTAYYTGNDEIALNAAGWYRGNSDQQTHPVAQKKPNAWGLYDMHGNVWQWCADWFADNYVAADKTDPTGPANGSLRVLRGGSWHNHSSNCRAANHDKYPPDSRGHNVGFRVVATAAGLD